MTEPFAIALAEQCAIHRERCREAAASLYVWLRTLRYLRVAFVVLPIVFGTLAGWDLLTADNRFRTVTAVFAFMAGLVPAVYAALKLDEHLPDAAYLGGEYKNLHIKFAELVRLGPLMDPSAFVEEYKVARKRLEAATSKAYTAPEWCVRWARRKIEAGEFGEPRTDEREAGIGAETGQGRVHGPLPRSANVE
jgi:hypothetical protein